MLTYQWRLNLLCIAVRYQSKSLCHSLFVTLYMCVYYKINYMYKLYIHTVIFLGRSILWRLAFLQTCSIASLNCVILLPQAKVLFLEVGASIPGFLSLISFAQQYADFKLFDNQSLYLKFETFFFPLIQLKSFHSPQTSDGFYGTYILRTQIVSLNICCFFPIVST